MQTLIDALLNAVRLIVTVDGDVVQYALRSVEIAFAGTGIAALLGVPLGILVAEHDFPAKRILVTVLNTLMGIPTVVVGLFIYSLISRQGPLGSLGLLFTVPGVIIGEVFLILPLVTALSLSAVTRVEHAVRRNALALGASKGQALWAVCRESRFGLLAAIIAGYGRVLGEVGVAMILGGNADRFTRTMSTAAVLHVDMGHFERALALGLVLLTLSLAINILLQLVQGRGHPR